MVGLASIGAALHRVVGRAGETSDQVQGSWEAALCRRGPHYINCPPDLWNTGIEFRTGTAEALGRVLLPDQLWVSPALLQRGREKNKVIVSLVVEPLKVNSLFP